MNQVFKLIEDIKHNFEENNESDTLLIDLIAADDTLWHQPMQPAASPPPLFCCYFYRSSFKNWQKTKNAIFLSKPSELSTRTSFYFDFNN